MVLPALQDRPYPLLPPGAHPATLDEIYEVFVQDAPFRVERERIWSAVLPWATQVSAYFPGAQIFMDGGFVTHKDFAAPSDVDFCLGIQPEQYQSLQDWEKSKVFTIRREGKDPLRPYGGLIDAFAFPRDNEARRAYWDIWWSSIRGSNRQIMQGSTKGYVEVLL